VNSLVGKRILLVDDDPALRQTLAEQLHLHEEFTTDEVDCGRAALEKTRSQIYDAIVLDVGLPDFDGREVCRLLRRGGVKCPIVMLTASAGDADQILGLEAGANDYVVKPFRLGVLLARLRAQLHQHEQTENATLSIGPYSFRPAAKLMLHDEKQQKVHLTEKETAILKFLYRAGDRPVNRDTLLGEIWGYHVGLTTHTLETHIYRLRQKIEADPSRPALLLTEPGGYRLAP